MKMELVDIGNWWDDARRTITIRNGTEERRVVASLIKDTDYVREWNFTAFGKSGVMYAELRNENGTCLCWGLR